MAADFLKLTASYHEMQLLLAINRRNGLRLPINPHELLPGTLDNVPVSRLLDDGVATLASDGAGTILRLTEQGVSHLRGVLVDYHLELMRLRADTDEFFQALVDALTRACCSQIVLYGASDTARVLLDFLQDSKIKVTAIVDDDVTKQGREFGGVPVKAPQELDHLDFDTVVVTTVMYQEGIIQGRSNLVPKGKRLIGLFDNLLNSHVGQTRSR
jgi:hypothetical protein